MFALIRVGLLVGLRSHALKALGLVALLVLAIALFASTFSGRQPMTVGLDVGLSGLRLVLLLMTLVWVQQLLAYEIERKTLYFMLAYPYSRSQYLLARFVTLALLAAMAVAVLGLLLWCALRLSNWSYAAEQLPQLDMRYWLLLLGIWLDLLVVLAFSVLLCSLTTTPFLPFLLSLAFALAARGLGSTLDYLRHSNLADADQARVLGPLLEYAYLWLPDLSRLDWRAAVLYSLPSDTTQMLWAVLMAVAYCVALLSLACVVFERRNFV